MVELQATTSHGTVTLIGVAVAEGGMVVTTADLLIGVRSIDMVGPGGKLEQASIVGTDATSNVALVNVPEDVPVAPFSDDAALGGGAPDTVLGYASSGGSAVDVPGHPRALAAVATGTSSDACPASGMAAITSSPGLATADRGRAVAQRERRGHRHPLRTRSGLVVR